MQIYRETGIERTRTQIKKFFLPCIINNARRASEREQKKKRKEFKYIRREKSRKYLLIRRFVDVKNLQALAECITVSGCVCDGKEIIHHMTHFLWVIWCGCWYWCGFPFLNRMFCITVNVTSSASLHPTFVQPNKLLQDFVLSYRAHYESLHLIQVIFHLQHH